MTATVTTLHHGIDLQTGQLLQLELDKRKISQGQLAEALNVSRQTVSAVINGHQRISKSLSKKLGVYFGNQEEYWRDLDRKQEAVALASQMAPATSSIMIDAEIEEALEAENLILDGYGPDRLRQASYDFIFDEHAFDLTTGLAVAVGADGITVQAGQTINMRTKERIHLKDSFVGCIGTTSELARFGLIVNTGHQSDPGFDGYLQFSVYKPTGKAIPIRRDAAIISITLHRLSRKPSRGFTQKQHSQDDTRQAQIAREEREHLTKALRSFVEKIVDVKEKDSSFNVGIKDLPLSFVTEPDRNSAIDNVARYLSGLIYRGWRQKSNSTDQQAQARAQLEGLALDREAILEFYRTLDAKVHELDDEISADWLEGRSPALLCSPGGCRQLPQLLDGLNFDAMLSTLISN